MAGNIGKARRFPAKLVFSVFRAFGPDRAAGGGPADAPRGDACAAGLIKRF